MIVDMHHVVLLVTEFDRSMDFYTRVLGFEQVSSDVDRRGDFLDAMFGVEGVVIKLGLVRAGGEIIEIIQPLEPSVLVSSDASANAFGIARIGFEVDDIEATVAEFQSRGVEFVGDIVDMTRGHYAGGQVVFFRDPDGILLELQQPETPGRVT